MSRKSLASMIMVALTPIFSAPALPIASHPYDTTPPKSNKGQIRSARPKASGAAQLKRQAKKRSNISKR